MTRLLRLILTACPDGCYKHKDASGSWKCCKCGQ
jgi:hypothetical protein